MLLPGADGWNTSGAGAASEAPIKRDQPCFRLEISRQGTACKKVWTRWGRWTELATTVHVHDDLQSGLVALHHHL